MSAPKARGRPGSFLETEPWTALCPLASLNHIRDIPIRYAPAAQHSDVLQDHENRAALGWNRLVVQVNIAWCSHFFPHADDGLQPTEDHFTLRRRQTHL